MSAHSAVSKSCLYDWIAVMIQAETPKPQDHPIVSLEKQYKPYDSFRFAGATHENPDTHHHAQLPMSAG